MTEYDYWKIFPRMPRKVTIGDRGDSDQRSASSENSQLLTLMGLIPKWVT